MGTPLARQACRWMHASEQPEAMHSGRSNLSVEAAQPCWVCSRAGAGGDALQTPQEPPRLQKAAHARSKFPRTIRSVPSRNSSRCYIVCTPLVHIALLGQQHGHIPQQAPRLPGAALPLSRHTLTMRCFIMAAHTACLPSPCERCSWLCAVQAQTSTHPSPSGKSLVAGRATGAPWH